MVTTSAPRRILVVDDDERIVAMLRRTLEFEGFLTAAADTGDEALRQARRYQPDLILLDVMLPGIDGLSVCKRLRAESSTALVLMLTARDAMADRVDGLDAGADDYLAKPFAYEELMARIRALLRRGDRNSLASDRVACGDLVVDLNAYEVYRNDRQIELRPLEFGLLAYFVTHPRRVLSRAQLYSAVWGSPVGAGSNVVDVYVGYLRSKLEAHGEPRMIQTVRGVGYVLRDA